MSPGHDGKPSGLCSSLITDLNWVSTLELHLCFSERARQREPSAGADVQSCTFSTASHQNIASAHSFSRDLVMAVAPYTWLPAISNEPRLFVFAEIPLRPTTRRSFFCPAAHRAKVDWDEPHSSAHHRHQLPPPPTHTHFSHYQKPVCEFD